MLKPPLGVLCPAVLAAALALSFAGCKTGSSGDKHSVQFSPAPRAKVGAQELAPVNKDTRSVTDLLREADKEFLAANDAQQQGNRDAALQHYSRMLELLAAANLDPSIFYSVRQEFGQIIDESTRQARVSVSPHYLKDGLGAQMSALQIPFPLPERVLAEIEEIQQVYPKSFQRGLNRSFRYVPWIQEEFRKSGIPPELAWLAMVESQYNVKIDSPVGAGGMWQFMKATGQRYNLRVDNYVDERYNWQHATQAAIAYLRDLHDYFDGNWALAIAAYNMGEYGLERAIAANGGERDFWKLIEQPPASDRIKAETKKYYPRFLATCIVASHPERYGFVVAPEGAEEIVRVPVRGVYALADLDKAMGLPSGTLSRLNPDLIAEITPPAGDYSLAVSPAHREMLAAALGSVPQVSPKAAPRRQNLNRGRGETVLASYKVRRGETIVSIAKKHQVSSDELMRINKLKSARSLRAGQTLKIPGAAAAPQEETPPVTVARDTSRGATGPQKSYTVRRGDTLSEIAGRYDVSVGDLMQWNNLSKRSRIHTGSTLLVSPPSAPVEDAPEAPPVVLAAATPEQIHEVQQGEYLAKIATQYDVKLDDLLAWNQLDKDSLLHVGDKLVVRGGSSNAETTVANKQLTIAQRVHEVRRGEYPAKIAGQYDVDVADLLSWNNLDTSSTLHIGDKLVIRGGK
ncbi:MAG: LysM peptidoglycan-binding domain-containing protein, partial [Candidatus Hydrogenedentes bacterium]|nr:LysM peptidoglycan-binding domain-containing protein [Candidatus Hydrogenedentota bacterium]